MSIRRRIWALPIISTVVFGVGLGVSASFTTSAFSSIKNTGAVDYPLLEKSRVVADEVQGVIEDLKSAVSEGEKKRLEQVEERAAKIRTQIAELGAIPGQKPTADRLLAEFGDYMSPALAAAKIMLGEPGDVQAAVGKMQSTLKTLEADLANTKLAAEKQFSAGISDSEASVQRVLTTNILSALIVIVGLITTAYFVVRSIWNQLGGEPEYARKIASAVAAGDLAMEIDIDDKDEKSLLAALKQMKDRLENLISNIKESAETIKLASVEIADGNADLSARTEVQAKSLEQTANSMQDLTKTVRDNVDHARHASSMAVEAADVASKGSRVFNDVIATMDDINRSAQKITDIISVIDGIAFQTNILALNAAVEAARAGEQGRGFAVVAAEVRSLAQRSAAAAKEIKDLIGDSTDKVNAGLAMVNQAGATMAEIVTSIKCVSDVTAEITSASQEQSSGIEAINSTMVRMDEMTQQNAGLVQQAALSAKSMEEQAGTLSQALSIFHLREVKTGYAPTAVPKLQVSGMASPRKIAASRKVVGG